MRVLRGAVAAGLFCFALGVLVVTWFAYDLPDIADVKPLDVQPGIVILAEDGTQIARFGGRREENVTLAALPAYVPQAFLAIEDRRFYRHLGMDPLGLLRAMTENLRARRWVQGGSTITQQLAKNLFLTPDKTLRRKVQEALMALKIERRFSKDDILEAYLNRVYFGAGAYGLEAAARTYFAKPAADLTVWESAVLAGLLKAPSRYTPLAHPDRALGRGKVVVRAMQDAGYISADEEVDVLRAARLDIAPVSGAGMRRYFADWVLNQIDSYAAEAAGDIIVTTTLSAPLQQAAEAAVTAFFANSVAPDKHVSQTALVTLGMDGAVRAMVGGRDYAASQFNRATQAARQPGSAFKPFVFLAALETGFDIGDTVEDAPFEKGGYRPKNYGGKYYGRVTLVQALMHSMNTATVRLLEQAGFQRLFDVTARAGFSQRFRPELATALGADEVTLLELTNAYAAIGNGGYGVWPYAVTEIRDAGGGVLYRHMPPAPTRVFAVADVRDMDVMLQQVVAQGTGQAARLAGLDVAGKTGTSQDYRDAWFVGYAKGLATGVWMGNDDNSPMVHVAGGGYPAQMWGQYMAQAVQVAVPETPGYGVRPTGGFSRLIDGWSKGQFGSGFGGLFGGGDVRPDNRPVYNR